MLGLQNEWVAVAVFVGLGLWSGYRLGYTAAPKEVHETTRLTIEGNMPFVRLEDLQRVPMEFVRMFDVVAGSEIYALAQLEGHDGQSIVAYTTDASLFYRLGKLKKGADFILVMDERERLVIAEL